MGSDQGVGVRWGVIRENVVEWVVIREWWWGGERVRESVVGLGVTRELIVE